MGIPATAEPWRQTQRKHVPNPPITLGLMMDVSGSMGAAEGPVATAGWTIAHAVHRNEGKVAAVAYGNAVHPIVRPGDNPRNVTVLAARGGTERFCEGLRALDGALNLSGGTGPRLLVVVSDGQYTHQQRIEGTRLVKRLRARGVHVLWVGVGSQHWDNPIEGSEYVSVGGDPDSLGRLVGATMVKMLAHA